MEFLETARFFLLDYSPNQEYSYMTLFEIHERMHAAGLSLMVSESQNSLSNKGYKLNRYNNTKYSCSRFSNMYNAYVKINAPKIMYTVSSLTNLRSTRNIRSIIKLECQTKCLRKDFKNYRKVYCFNYLKMMDFFKGIICRNIN